MNVRVVVWILLPLLQSLSALMSVPQKKGTIEGVVLATETNEPIEDAVVILASKEGSDRPVINQALTDRQGRFAFKDLSTGLYRLAFESDGFVRQEYGQRNFPGSGMPLALSVGQELHNLVVRLTRTATVTGRILDSDKQPLAGVPLELIRVSYRRNGERDIEKYGAAETDDHGEYRLYFLTPGRYYLRAGTPQARGCCQGLRPTPNEVPAAFPSMYFPGVADFQLALPLDLKAGSEMNLSDWTMSRQPLFRIRGTVIDSATGQPPGYVELWLNSDSDYPVGQFGGDKGTYENGVFQFRDLVPGLYGLTAKAPPSRGYLPLDVRSDLDGLTLQMSPGQSVSGRVRIDELDSNVTALFQDGDPTGPLIVSIRRISGGPGQSFLQDDLKPDGTFRIVNVAPGEYRLNFWFRYGASYYVREARFAGADVLNGPLRIDGHESESNSLDLVLSSKFGALSGSVSTGVKPAEGAQVVLVPDGFRLRTDLFRDVKTSQDGRFSISNVVPGDYKVFAWESIEPYAWFDPEVLARAESNAKTVHVGELSTQTVELRSIVAQ